METQPQSKGNTVNCIHELRPFCYDCNGGDPKVWPKPYRTDYRLHTYDLLDPETARVILAEVKIAVPLPPSGNGCPSELDYEDALEASWELAEDESWYCENCNEARQDNVDEEDVTDFHLAHMDYTVRPPATQILPLADKKAMLADFGQYLWKE